MSERSDAAVDAPSFDPYDVPDDPYPLYRELRDHHPVLHEERRDLWVLSRFADVEAVLRDPARFSSASGVALEGRGESAIPLLLEMDPPRHDELRRLVSRAFTPRRVADLEPRIRELASSLLDEQAGGTVDVMAFASALPTMVIAELLGVPTAHHERFREWVESVITVDPGAIPEGEKVPDLLELFELLRGIVAERREERRDDMISALLDAEVDGIRLDDREVLGFTLLILAAGFETTKNLIGNGIDVAAVIRWRGRRPSRPSWRRCCGSSRRCGC